MRMLLEAFIQRNDACIIKNPPESRLAAAAGSEVRISVAQGVRKRVPTLLACAPIVIAVTSVETGLFCHDLVLANEVYLSDKPRLEITECSTQLLH